MIQQEIEPTYITFEQAKWLKKKGFNVEVEGLFFDGEFINIFPKKANNTDFASTRYNSAPEQWQVVEWLDRNNDLYVHVQKHIRNGLKCYSPFINNVMVKGDVFFNDFDSQEEAYSAAFNYIQQNNLI